MCFFFLNLVGKYKDSRHATYQGIRVFHKNNRKFDHNPVNDLTVSFCLGNLESGPGSPKLCEMFLFKRGIIARDDLIHALYIIPAGDFQKVNVYIKTM